MFSLSLNFYKYIVAFDLSWEGFDDDAFITRAVTVGHIIFPRMPWAGYYFTFQTPIRKRRSLMITSVFCGVDFAIDIIDAKFFTIHRASF